jgi:tetratricopeptide (TPR) repeat protein
LVDPLGRGQWAATLSELAQTLCDQGKRTDARRLLENADRRLTLHGIPPEPEVRFQLRSCYSQLARVCACLGKYREAASAAAELGRLSSDQWKGLHEAAVLLGGCISLAEKDATLSPARRKARADKYARQAQALLTEALQRGKDDPECQNTLAWLLINSPAPQLRDLKKALALAQKAVAAAPHKASCWAALGAAHYRLGDGKAAIPALEKSLSLEPNRNPDCQNALAWLLVLCPAPPVRDVKRALALARKAVAAAPQKAQYWTTLGAAHYRAGDWKAAVTALEKSLRLESQGHVLDGLFLAMAHWQRGAKEEARRWYDRADRAMKKAPRREEELWRVRAEAAALIGLPRPARAP